MSEGPESHEPELQHFGKYLLDQELARGGMARVFRARLRGPGGFEKKLVVKQILPDLARDPSFVELFVKEANTLVQMSHPNLVPVYELGVIDGVYFLAMEWVEGATVAELLQTGPLSAAAVAQLGAQIAEALRYAHERFQIVHRDVTPRNLIVDEAGHARLLDFGIAAPIGHVRRGELFGSPGYIAPEQLHGEPLGPTGDLFSLGAVLYEARRGTAAFPAARAATEHDPERYVEPELLPDTDPEIAQLVQALLRLDPARRPSSAAEVATRLRTWLSEHHPQGVERELAERAQSARRARDAQPTRPSTGSAAVSSGRIEVRSIAVSPALEQLLQQATQRIERVEPETTPTSEEPAAPAAPDPEGQRVFRRFIRDILVVSVALMVAIHLAERAQREPDDESDPAVSTALAPDPAHGPAQGAGGSGVKLLAAEAGGASEAPAEIQAVRPAPAPTPEIARSGLVTVSAAPWAEVQLDGRSIGITPRRKLPVRAGRHTLDLSCPPLGRDARVVLDVQPDEQLQVVVDLNESPPKVSVR